MNLNSSQIQRFCHIFKIPDFMKPWLDRFFEAPEIDLVLMLADGPMSAEEISNRIHKRHQTAVKANVRTFLERAYKRGIINRRQDGRYEPADLHTRYDVWAMFEGWKDIPESIREQLNARELEYSERHYQDSVKGMKKGQARNPSEIYAEYILLHESKALLDKVDHVYLLPCTCRSMMQRCDQSVYTCLRFDNYRNLGWEISKSRAKEIIQAANKKGLMQTAEVALTEEGAITGAICNCCADCCAHPELAQRYDAQNIWPLSRYVARHLADRCTACGLCAKRCPFQAFTAEKIEPDKKDTPHLSAEKLKKIYFHKKECRGCGVCSTACPEEAIVMIPLDACNETYSLITRLGCGSKSVATTDKS
ncbi:MAG: 4Fe-4S binding protein [Desulfobacterales bacterium]|jgi:Pyruvate/2-oxoacid:ferredoxin oxidoreductase delta subunit/predicted transcriptional regulator